MAANAVPPAKGPSTPAISQQLAISVAPLISKLRGTTWASSALAAGSEKPRAMPATNATVYSTANWRGLN